MTISITSRNSLRAGIDSPPMACGICKKETMFLDYVSSMCDTCGADTAWLYEGRAGFIRSIRIHLKLTRKELADTYGCKVSTIKKYEYINPSNKYCEWFYGFVEDKVSGLQGNSDE